MPNIHTQKPGRGAGVLLISSDRDDQRIFWGGGEVKLLIPGFLGVRKFGKYFFWVGKFKKGFLWLYRII